MLSRKAWLQSEQARAFPDPATARKFYDRFRAACAEVANGRWTGEITVGGNPE